ncbi:MAG: glycosyltransferase family 4 protein [Chloroflexota bacterium]
MKVAHVSATFPPYPGGTGQICLDNAFQLARLGHQVTVFTARDGRDDEAYHPKMTVRRLPALFRLGNAPFLPGLALLEGFDVIHLHYPFYFGAELLMANSVVRRSRYVVTYHQDVHLPGLLEPAARAHHRLVAAPFLRRARRVMVTTMDYARSSRLRGLVGPGRGLVVELPNGVDPDRFSPELDPAPLRAMYRLGPDERVVLFVGGLDRPHYFKGVDVLLEAMARPENGLARLLIVGDGDLRPGYESHARALGLGERALFCGRVPAGKLPLHYAICDLLVLPSTTMGEAFGVVLLEAMASGRPVIASSLPGVRAVVSDGVDGLLARPGDAEELSSKIRRLLDDPERRREMGAAGRAKVEEEYAWSQVTPRLVKVYEEAMAA